MLISIIGVQNNKREKDWLNFWRDEFERLGYEVAINSNEKKLLASDVLVWLDDGRRQTKLSYCQLGIFWQVKKSETRHPARLLVAYDESTKLDSDLAVYFDHITKTEKGLINTIKDYLYFYNKNARSR